MDTNDLITLINAVVAKNESWLKEYNIDYGIKGDWWVLNYCKVGPRNQYNRLARGIIIHQPTGKIVSFPFVRFYNFGEKEADVVDFANSEVMEKLDGTFVGVFFPNETPHWQTRKMVSTHDCDFEMKSFYGENFKLMSLIGEFVNKLNWDLVADKNEHTYMFEFIHKHTKVITNYEFDQYGLYLIGCRNILTHAEKSEHELDEFAKLIGAKRPRRWEFTSHEEIVSLFDSFPKDFEGFVVRERKSTKRVKVKSDDYVKVHHLLTKISYKKLIPLWLDGEAEEIIAYFPEAAAKVAKIEKAFCEFCEKATERVLYWHKQNLDRKSLALKITGQTGPEFVEHDQTIRGLIFQFYSEPKSEIRQKVEDRLKDPKRTSVYKLIEVMGLDDKNDATVALVEEV